MENIPKEKLEELTLILAYATGWEEKGVVRTWKGYPFELINSLLEKKLIAFSFKAKSMYFTPEGAAKAKELVDQFFAKSNA